MSFFAQSIQESRRTAALAAPIIAGHVGQMAMGWADAVMVGKVGVVPLAACAFGNTVMAVPFVFGFGLLSAVSVRVSHAFGANDARQCGDSLRAGLYLALLLGGFLAGGIIVLIPFLDVLGQGPEITREAIPFLFLCAVSVVPVFLTTVAKNFCEALSRPWVPFWLMIGAVLFNVGLNWVFIYGHLGAPALGLTGAGLATLTARIALTAALFGYLVLSRRLRPMLPAGWGWQGLAAHFRPLLKIGLPTGGMHLCEVSGFAFGSIMMGWLGVNALAAHQVAITCAATTFMIPLGLAQAVSVRVGQARGSGRRALCRPIVFGALGLTVIIMLATATMFTTTGPFLAGLFVDEAAIVSLAAHLLVIAGLFQLFDGTQAVCAGALRGFEDTRVPMLIGILAYWVVALPVSYVCAFRAGFGPPGVWFGFVTGLMVAAALLFTRILRQLRQAETAGGCPASPWSATR